MTSSRILPLSAVLSVCLFAAAAFGQKVGPTVRITSPINANQLVTLKGTVHPLANAQNDRGLAPQSMQLNRMHLILKRSPAQETALKQLIQEQTTPGSPNYHKWLTPAQFAAEFGPSKQDIATLENWLSSQGFTINKLEPGNQVLDISGTVSQLRSAFHTQIHKYMVNGRLHYANANNPSIPAALAPVVGGFVSLNNFPYKNYARNLGEATYDPSTGQAAPSWTTGSGTASGDLFVLSPADYAKQYDLAPLYNSGINGSGQTIAIVNESNININLVNQFRSLFSLPANPPQVIIDGNDPGIDGINNPDGPNYASVEAYLDVEWAGAVAPDATIDLVIAADTSLESGLALAAEHAVYSDIAPVVSLSFGLCEAYQGSSNQFWSDLWQQAAAQGQTVVVSTGDSGSAGCDYSSSQYATAGLAVNGLASTPYDVAVGGTDFFYSSYNQGSSAINSQLGTYWNTSASNSTATPSIKGYIPEQAWNDSQYGLNIFDYYSSYNSTTIGGTGGGASSAALCSTNTYSSSTGLCTGTASGYAKPSWQTGVTGIPTDGVRDTPDVALFAADGQNDSFYPICATDGDCQPVSSGSTVQILGVGGTSAAAPSFAGIMALVNQKYGRQGQADTILYPLKAQFPTAFHDVTQGTNSVPCEILPTASTNCISVTNPITVQVTSSSGVTTNITEGQLGSGATAYYNAGAGYNLATGLGSIDAANLVNNWGNVTLTGTSVSLTPSTATSFTHGTAFKFNGTVTATSGTPTGDVALMTDSNEMSQQGQSNFALDSSGNYSGSLTTLPGGSYNIWASYGGDSKNAAAISSKIPITVSPEASGIAFGLFANASSQYLTSNITSSVDYGTQLMLSARVAPSGDVATLQTCTSSSSTTCPSGYSAPTGTVTFKDNSSAINTAVINSEGDAEYNAPFSVGSHSVSASYSGDNSYNASTASPITFTVAKDTPVLNLYSSAYDTQNNAVITGTNQPNSITVEISNGAQSPSSSSTSCPTTTNPVPVAAPTGTVTLTSTLAGLSGTATLQPIVDSCFGAVASIATFTIPSGAYSGSSYNVTIAYSGDSNYNALTAANNSFTVPVETINNDGYLTPTIAATLSGSTVSPNTTVTIDGTVTGTIGKPAPTGQIYLYSSGNYITYATLSPPTTGVISTFSMTLNSQTFVQGSNQMTLEYFGDTNYNPAGYALSTSISNPLSDFTMTPDSATVPITVGGSATDNLELASVNNFTGTVSLTCKAPTGVTCNLPGTVTLSAGGNTTAALNLSVSASAAAQDYNILITGTDSTGEYIHTVGIRVVAGSPNLYLTNSGGINISSVGGSGTSTFTATPINGFTGTVNLTCAVTGTPSGAGTPITCSASDLSQTSLTFSGSAAQTSKLTINTTASTTPGNYQVTVTGTSGQITAKSVVGVAVAVAPPPDFKISNSGNISVTAGATTNNTSTITIQSENGFNSAVSLACAISPTAASHPATCSFSSSSVTPAANGTATSTLKISTTATTTSMNDHKTNFWPAAGGGTVMACLLFFWIPKKRRSWLAMVVLLVFFVSMAGMACGGGGGGSSSGGGTTTTPGTSPGTYTVTVTGTSGSGSTQLQHSTQVTLTVQ